MSEALIVGIVRQAIELAVLVSLPMLLAGLVAGVLVSIFQTVTSIQDNVLAFIPRAAAIFITFALTFPWMLRADDRLRAPAGAAAAGADPVIELAPDRAPRRCCWCGPGMLIAVGAGLRRHVRADHDARSA